MTADARKVKAMKFILMMNTMKAGCEPLKGWSKEDFQTHCRVLIKLHQDLRESGELVSVEGLSFPDQAKLVRAGQDGKPITDGVFPESKEFLASFSIVDVENPERAYEIAAQISAAPGPGGRPLNMPIEVRPVMSGPPPEML
ncbi:MAG TPA: YciI family protein [Bryocella sp.]|nr:YciI family protein [Bryocella sp.]